MANSLSPVPRFNAGTQYFDPKTPSGMTTAGYQQFAKLQEQQGVAPITSGVPTVSALPGAFAFDPTTNTLHIYNGTSWVSSVLA
jgi:hypothetical protein